MLRVMPLPESVTTFIPYGDVRNLVPKRGKSFVTLMAYVRFGDRDVWETGQNVGGGAVISIRYSVVGEWVNK
jgi:hypothetical protein